MKVIDQMRLFMEPRSVTLIGVSRATGEGSFNILENLLRWGFSKAYPSVAEVPGEIDLAVIATPRSSVSSLVKECLGRGIKAIIVVAPGFADADEEGEAHCRLEVLSLCGGDGLPSGGGGEDHLLLHAREGSPGPGPTGRI